MGQQSRGFTPFQKKAHKILIRNGWFFQRFTGKNYAIYAKPGCDLQVVSCTPKNPTDALKAVQRCAGIREGKRRG